MPPPSPPRSDGLAERIARSLPALARYVRRRMGPELQAHESASDIVQSTARELLRSGRFEDRGEASFQRWLHAAAENKLRNRARHWRAGGRGRTEPLATEPGERDGDPRASTEAVLAEERARLARAVARLGAEHQLVLRRVQMEGASYDEVARELDRSPEAVRKLQARALARLSTLLGASDPP